MRRPRRAALALVQGGRRRRAARVARKKLVAQLVGRERASAVEEVGGHTGHDRSTVLTSHAQEREGLPVVHLLRERHGIRHGPAEWTTEAEECLGRLLLRLLKRVDARRRVGCELHELESADEALLVQSREILDESRRLLRERGRQGAQRGAHSLQRRAARLAQTEQRVVTHVALGGPA